MLEHLELNRRHVATCKNRGKGRHQTNCSCPVWCDGFPPAWGGQRVRRSLGRDMGLAYARAEKLEKEGPDSIARQKNMSLSEMVETYLADCRQRNLAPQSIRKYTGIMHDLVTFAGPQPPLDHRFLDIMTRFRVEARNKRRPGEELSAATRADYHRTIISFFDFAVERKWVAENWARKLKVTQYDHRPTLPFSDSEVRRLFGFVEMIRTESARARVRAAMLLMLGTGLRISDVITLERHAVDRGRQRLLRKTMKTGAEVYLKLRPEVIDALDALPIASNGTSSGTSERYFFWTGLGGMQGKLTAIGTMRDTIERLGEKAGIDARPHRFRDTFARMVLERGASLRTLQLLLGHSSITTTEQHYAHFVVEQQHLLDLAIDSLPLNPEAFGSLLVNPVQDRLRNTEGHVAPLAAPAA